MKKREAVVIYNGEPEETNKFQFRVFYKDIFYNAVYKDEYMQVIENIHAPLEKVPDEHIEVICDAVESWFVETDSNAWWIKK